MISRPKGPVVAKYAVEVDWNFDSGDSDGTMWTVTNLFANVTQQLTSGAYGIMLMHGVYTWTQGMLPMLISYVQSNGYKLATLERRFAGSMGCTRGTSSTS